MRKRITVPVDDIDAAFITDMARAEERSVAAVIRRILRAARADHERREAA